jgi:hypothetical protein
MRCLCLLLLLATSAIPQQLISIFSLPDISGTGSVVQLSSTQTAVHWCQLVAPSTNSNSVRWGDSAITSSRGSQMAPGSGQFIPPGPTTSVNPPGGYVFYTTAVWVLVQSGDTLSASCAK